MRNISDCIIKYIGMFALTVLAACDSIYDSLPPCEYRVHFVYDYNMKFADAFQHEVTKATLFICDDAGKFLQRRDIEGAELKANSIALNLDPGTYRLLTWAGLDDSSYEWPELTPRVSTIEEIRVKTLRAADGTQPSELEPLWHALDTLTVTGTQHEEKEISLAKNTNKVRVILQDDTYGNSINAEEFTFQITADNGYMDYDNSLLPDPVITYLPYYQESVDVGAEGDMIDGNPAGQYAAVAEMNTMRLMEGRNYRLIVRHKDFENDVLNVNLNNYLLLTKMEGHKISAQEYLDRQDEYSIIFFLRKTDDPGMPYVCYKVQVKDWVRRINDNEVLD